MLLVEGIREHVIITRGGGYGRLVFAQYGKEGEREMPKQRAEKKSKLLVES